MFEAVSRVFPQIKFLVLFVVATGAMVSQSTLERLTGEVHTLIRPRIRVGTAFRLTLLQVMLLGLAKRAAFVGQ